MSGAGSLGKRLSELDTSQDFILEMIVLAITERICEVMKREGITRAELANRIGKSPAYVTKFLNGQPNMTMKTLVGIAVALGEGIDVFVPSSVREERARASIRHRARQVAEFRYSLPARSSTTDPLGKDVVVPPIAAYLSVTSGGERRTAPRTEEPTGDQDGTDNPLAIAA